MNVLARLSSLGRTNTLASRAEHLAQALLHEPLPRRWAHVQGVAARASSLAPVLGAEADLLEAAEGAVLHAIIEAEERRLADLLGLEFESAPYVLSSVLTCCDMTTSPDGELVPVEQRLAEIHHRYRPWHLVSRSIQRATPMILRAVEQVHGRAARTVSGCTATAGPARCSRRPAAAWAA